MDIPGYGGFVPSVKSKNEYGKTFSRISREMYDDPKLGNCLSNINRQQCHWLSIYWSQLLRVQAYR